MRALLLPLLLISLMLASCGPTGALPAPQQVADAIKGACGLLVPLADVAALIGKVTPVGSVADGIDSLTHMVCDAFKAQIQVANARQTLAPASGTLVVNGVLIHYQSQ